MKSGWFKESRRHALASKGIKTGHKLVKAKFLVPPPAGAYIPFGAQYRIVKDTDGDGVPDHKDCAPKDPSRQHSITSIRGENGMPMDDHDKGIVANEIKEELTELGYDANVVVKNGRIDVKNVRLSEKYLEEKGYNISPYSGHRGRILNWDNWVEVNNKINKVLDKYAVSANIKSLGGKFKVREGMRSFTEDDWEDEGYSNVGSMVSPVERRDAWRAEGIPKKKKLAKPIKEMPNPENWWE